MRLSPLAQVLVIASNAGTPVARDELRYIRELIDSGADWEPYARAVQVARDTGALGIAEAHCLLDLFNECAVGCRVDDDPTLIDLSAQMRALERADGLEDGDSYFTYDAPPEWLVINDKWEKRFDAMRVELFRRIGEAEMARALILRPDDFEGDSAIGRAALFDPRDE